MWHEARKNEKHVRKLLVDYRKRSARRQEFYDKIKQDPTKFLQVHGRKLKYHIDGTVTKAAATNNHMMPWQGNNDNMIDRFDVRTHLDYINEVTSEQKAKVDDEEGLCNFERYRVLIYNDYKKISESQHLRQIYINEQYPEISLKEKHEKEIKKKKLALGKAQIGFDYGSSMQTSKVQNDGDSESEDEEDILQELEEIPPISELSMDTLATLDSVGHKKYNLKSIGFSDGALRDQAIIDKADKELQIENEKLQLTGRKGRRERRILKDERLKNRDIGPLSYVSSLTHKEHNSETSSSSSSSDSDSENEKEEDSKNKSEGKIEFITSFDIDSTKTANHDTSPDTFNPETQVDQNKSAKKDKHKTSKRKYSRRKRSSSSSERENSRHRSRRPNSQERRHRRSRSCDRYSSRHRRRRSRSSSREYRHYRRRSSSRSRSRSSSRGRRSNSKERNLSYSKSTATAVISSTKASLTASSSKSKNKQNALKNLTPQEKLKIKMQRALNKQLKKDRAIQVEKTRQAQEEQMAREDDLREMARKRRKRRPDDDDDY